MGQSRLEAPVVELFPQHPKNRSRPFRVDDVDKLSDEAL
jgi:hypothetical protein